MVDKQWLRVKTNQDTSVLSGYSVIIEKWSKPCEENKLIKLKRDMVKKWRTKKIQQDFFLYLMTGDKIKLKQKYMKHSNYKSGLNSTSLCQKEQKNWNWWVQIMKDAWNLLKKKKNTQKWCDIIRWHNTARFKHNSTAYVTCHDDI